MPTLIFEDKFDTGGTWNTSGGTPVIVSSPAPPSGGQALEVNAIGDFVFWTLADNIYTRLVWGVWLWVDTDPAGDTRCFKIDPGPTEGWWGLHPVTGDIMEFSIRSDGTPTISTAFGGATRAFPLRQWTWCQVMYDVSADPWEIRARIGNGTVLSATGAATASFINGNVTLGNTVGGSTYTAYFGHAKLGTAANDDDWWQAPTGIIAIDKFDHGFTAVEDYDTIFGTPTAVTTPLYQGRLNSLEINAALANEGVRKNLINTPTRAITAFPFRMTNLSSQSFIISSMQIVTANVQARIAMAPTGIIHAYISGGSAANGPTLVADEWYWIEMIVDVGTDPHSIYWRVNGVDQTTATKTNAADTLSFVQLLSGSGDSGADWYAGGYWAWGTPASNTDWVGEPSVVEIQSYYSYRTVRVRR